MDVNHIDDAERIVFALDPENWDDSTPDCGGFIDIDTSNKTAGHTGWWLGFSESQRVVWCLNGDPVWSDMDDDEFRTLIDDTRSDGEQRTNSELAARFSLVFD
jgi:hypothetical protein